MFWSRGKCNASLRTLGARLLGPRCWGPLAAASPANPPGGCACMVGNQSRSTCVMLSSCSNEIATRDEGPGNQIGIRTADDNAQMASAVRLFNFTSGKHGHYFYILNFIFYNLKKYILKRKESNQLRSKREKRKTKGKHFEGLSQFQILRWLCQPRGIYFYLGESSEYYLL